MGCNKNDNTEIESFELETAQKESQIKINEESNRKEIRREVTTESEESETSENLETSETINEETTTTTSETESETETTEKTRVVVSNINSNYNYNTKDYSKFIFIGDSRTEGLKYTIQSNPVEDNIVWSCKTAQGYKWMINTGVPQIESEITKNTAVIILMGVNDLYNVHNYISYINSKAQEWNQLGATTYFVSVGPIQNDPYISNNDIEDFNSTIQNGLSSVHYIDIYSRLINEGFQTMDGIHYTTETYKYIYNLIKQNL